MAPKQRRGRPPTVPVNTTPDPAHHAQATSDYSRKLEILEKKLADSPTYQAMIAMENQELRELVESQKSRIEALEESALEKLPDENKRTTKNFVRSFLLQTAREKTPVFETYQDLCRCHPGREINYRDFERQYYQLFYERIDSERSPLSLKDLPVLVLEKITGKLPLRDCLSFRKVSQELRGLVNSSKLYCPVIKILFTPARARMVIDDLELGYFMTLAGGCEVYSRKGNAEEAKKYQVDRRFTQACITDASSFLGNPQLDVDTIEFQNHYEFDLIDFMRYLGTLNHQLNVRTIRSLDLGILQSVQGFMKPEKLEEIICICHYFADDLIRILQTDSEILKNPKLIFGEISFHHFGNESSASFLEFLKSMNSKLNVQSMEVVDTEWIPTILDSLDPERVGSIKIHDLARLTIDQFNALARSEKWKGKIRLECWTLPDEVAIEKLAVFKAVRCGVFECTDENFIQIKEVLLKSPHLEEFELIMVGRHVHDELEKLYKRIDKILSQDPNYDASTRKFAIPKCTDYFQMGWKSIVRLENGFGRTWQAITIKRISPK